MADCNAQLASRETEDDISRRSLLKINLINQIQHAAFYALILHLKWTRKHLETLTYLCCLSRWFWLDLWRRLTLNALVIHSCTYRTDTEDHLVVCHFLVYFSDNKGLVQSQVIQHHRWDGMHWYNSHTICNQNHL